MFPDITTKCEIAPLFSISTQGTLKFENQTLKDWSICDSSGRVGKTGDLSTFSTRMGRYLFVSMDDYVLSEIEKKDRKFLFRIFHAMMRQDLSMLYLLVNDERVGCVISSSDLYYCGDVPDMSRSPWVDLHSFFSSLNPRSVARMIADRPWDLSVLQPIPTGKIVGYRRTPFSLDRTAMERDMTVSIVDALPNLLPENLWTAPSNRFYGFEDILKVYARCKFPSVQILGKLQHGWQPTCGIDGEYGFFPEVRFGKHPAFIWSQRNLDDAKEAGIPWATPIGAPWIYLDHEAPSKPAYPNSLLCFPTHSIPDYQISSGWSAYADFIRNFAAENGFTSAVVCLFYLDYAKPEVREAITARGLSITTCGEPGANFLRRIENLLRMFPAVTSEHVSTTAFYAQALGIPYVVAGPLFHSDPPDPDEGPTGDPKWLLENFPSFLELGPARPDIADKELGLEFKRSPDELRSLLFGWLEDD